MSGVTACRLGSSPLTFDWSGSALVKAGTGAGARGYAPDAEAARDAWKTLLARFAAGEVGYHDAVVDDHLSQAAASEALAARLRADRPELTDVLVLGIGGSALGPISLLSALQDRADARFRFHFLENPDPFEWRSTLARLRPESTLVLTLAKSGTTFETLAQLRLALEWLGQPRWPAHVVLVTDPEKGDLRALARSQSIPTLEIAPSIGGRFSVFSPVGLFPAALAGLSIEQFLLGARQARDAMEKTLPEKNPVFVLAQEVLRHARPGAGRVNHVCMPYSTRLRQMGGWFVQMWGESLGKDGLGFNPMAAVGATDQHSILQLLRDGPDDKLTLFVAIDHVDEPVAIPVSPLGHPLRGLAAFRLLEGHSLQMLLETELRATAKVLSRRGRPNVTVRLDRLDERSLGALYYALSSLTAVTGTMMGVNPFDQPGVEEAKIYIRESLGAAAPGTAATEESEAARALDRLRPRRES